MKLLAALLLTFAVFRPCRFADCNDGRCWWGCYYACFECRGLGVEYARPVVVPPSNRAVPKAAVR